MKNKEGFIFTLKRHTQNVYNKNEISESIINNILQMDYIK